jgi:hypothetical protein
MNNITGQISPAAYPAIIERMAKLVRVLFAIAIIAFGVENLIWARFGKSMVPVIP